MELAEWLAIGYAPSYRTACLILRNPADAEEAVQEAFLRAWRFRGALPPGADVRPWLYRVVVNACCSRLRSETAYRSRTTDDAALATLPAAGPTPESAALASADAQAVVDALAELPEHLRVAVVLRYYAGLSEKEIATAIRRRPGTVKSRLHEARQRLATDPRLRALVDVEEDAR